MPRNQSAQPGGNTYFAVRKQDKDVFHSIMDNMKDELLERISINGIYMYAYDSYSLQAVTKATKLSDNGIQFNFGFWGLDHWPTYTAHVRFNTDGERVESQSTNNLDPDLKEILEKTIGPKASSFQAMNRFVQLFMMNTDWDENDANAQLYMMRNLIGGDL